MHVVHFQSQVVVPIICSVLILNDVPSQMLHIIFRPVFFLFLVGIYCEPKGSLMSLVEGHRGGVTHLLFSPDANRLYSGGRKVIF